MHYEAELERIAAAERERAAEEARIRAAEEAERERIRAAEEAARKAEETRLRNEKIAKFFVEVVLPITGVCFVKARNRKTRVEKKVYAARQRAEQKVTALEDGEPMMNPNEPCMQPAPKDHPFY